MTIGVSGYTHDEYFEMDEGWIQSQLFARPDAPKMEQQNLIEYSSHELSDRLEDGGWNQFPGYAPVVRRQGSMRQMIVPAFEEFDLNRFAGWYLIIDSEVSDIDTRAGLKSPGDPNPRFKIVSSATYNSPGTDPGGFVGGLYYRFYPTLGELLDGIDNRSAYRGMTEIKWEYPEPPHDPNLSHPFARATIVDPPMGFYPAWVDYWMRLIP